MSETQNGCTASAQTPVTLISQVKRVDVIRMLEKASTRLFHNGSQIHAAELTQASLYLRQDGERLLSQAEHDDLCKRTIGIAIETIALSVSALMGLYQFDKSNSPGFVAVQLQSRIQQLGDLVTEKENENQELQKHIWAMEERIKSAARRRRNKKTKRKGRK